MSAWSVKTRRARSRCCRDARVYGHTNTVMHINECSHACPLPRPFLSGFICPFRNHGKSRNGRSHQGRPRDVWAQQGMTCMGVQGEDGSPSLLCTLLEVYACPVEQTVLACSDGEVRIMIFAWHNRQTHLRSFDRVRIITCTSHNRRPNQPSR